MSLVKPLPAVPGIHLFSSTSFVEQLPAVPGTHLVSEGFAKPEAATTTLFSTLLERQTAVKCTWKGDRTCFQVWCYFLFDCLVRFNCACNSLNTSAVYGVATTEGLEPYQTFACLMWMYLFIN